MKKLFLVMAALALLGLSGIAQAGVVFDGGAPSQWSGNTVSVDNSGTGVYWTYDDFSLSVSGSVLGVRLWILERPYSGLTAGAWDGTLSYRIATNTISGTTNKPNTTFIASGSGVSVSRSATGENQVTVTESKEYLYEFDLASSVALNANEKYWFGVHLGTNNGNYRLYWETSNTSGTHSYGDYSWTGKTLLSQNMQDNAFQLLNSSTAAPEPSSILALVGGLGSLLAFRRRKA